MKNLSAPAPMPLKVAAVCASEATLTALGSLDSAGMGVSLSAGLGSAQTLASVLSKEQPDVVLLDLPTADEQSMAQIEDALVSEPGVHVVLVSTDRSVEFLMRAMRAGVREVLPAPMNPLTVQQAIKHVQGHHPGRAHQREALGHVLAMIPAKGGAGATFLATNLAYALARQGKLVAVLDLNLYLGDAVLFLGNSSVVSSVVDLARQTQRMDATLMDSSMIKLNKNLHLLAAPESPGNVKEVQAEDIEKIVTLARSRYDYVVLDVNSTLDQVTIKALDMADTIYLALQLTLPFVRAAKLMASVFRALGYSASKLHVVVNRYEKSGDISLADVEKASALKVARTIPNSHGVVNASINQGVPMLELAPRDPVSRALSEWAEELAPTTAHQNKGWLQRFLGMSS